MVDKYRPKALEDLLGNKDTIQTLGLILSSSEMPHLIFTGPPGTGKTTCAKIISKAILKEKAKDCVLELNASDERGIDVVRTKIKSFARKKVDLNTMEFKIIILDEADSMTASAQQAMRRVMECYSDECRFILICNTFTKIFDPIQSRCAVLKFNRLNSEEIILGLNHVIESEGLKVARSAVDVIVKLCEGDMRQALNIIQGSVRASCIVEDKTVLRVTGQPSPIIVEKIVDLLLKKKCDEALDLFDKMWDEKYDPVDLITAFFKVGRNMDHYDILKCVGMTHLRIVEGVNTRLQFYALFYDILSL